MNRPKKPCRTCMYFEAGDEDGEPDTCTWGDTMNTPIWFRGYDQLGSLDEITGDTLSHCLAHDDGN